MNNWIQNFLREYTFCVIYDALDYLPLHIKHDGETTIQTSFMIYRTKNQLIQARKK